MTYFEAALQVLRSARQPLTAREIMVRAEEAGLISTPRGKTPHATLAAKLYLAIPDHPELVKLEEPGKKRARPGSVRWTVVSHSTRASSNAKH